MNPKRPAFKAACLTVGLLMVAPAYPAGIPVIDGTSVTLALRKLVTDVKSWARDEVLQRAGMETDIQIAKDRQASDTNIAANTIIRITDAIEETHNQAMDAQVTPSFMACKNVSVARAKKTSRDAARDRSLEDMTEYWNKELTPPGESRAAYTRRVNEQISQKMDAVNEVLAGTGKEQAFSRADVFMRTGQYQEDLVYSEAEVEASELFIDLLIGPYSARAELLMGDKPLSELSEKERIELAEASIRKGVLRAVLEDVRADYLPDEDGNSMALARYDFIVNSRAASDEWQKRMTCTKDGGGPANCASDSIVLKDIANMMGQELELAHAILRQRKNSNMLLTLIAKKSGNIQ